MKQFFITTLIVIVGLFTVNYWFTAILKLRDPMVGCWPIIDPVIGFCF